MFAQVIQGKISDSTAVRAALERWVTTLSADAPEWLGSTAGVTDDGTLIAVARFGSA